MQNHKISLSEVCCVVLFFLYSLGKIYIFSTSDIYLYLREGIELCIYALMIYIIIKKKLSNKEFFLFSLIGSILLYGYLSVGYAVWFRAILMIFILKNVNFRKVCKSLFYATLIPLLTGILLYLLRISDSGVIRRGAAAWGFSSPNTFAMLIVTVWMLWLCSKSYISTKDYISTLILTFFGYLLHGSRSFVVVMCLLPFLDWTVKKLMLLRKSELIREIVCFSQAFFLTLSVILVKLYPVNAFVQGLNPLLGGRVFLNYYNYNKYGVSLFGKAVSLYNTTDRVYNDVFKVYSNANYSTVDNVYIAVLITMGIVQTIIFMIGYYLLVRKAWKNKNAIVVVIAIIFSAYGFTETAPQEIYMNFVYLYIMSYDVFPEENKLRNDRKLSKTKMIISHRRKKLHGFY